MSKVQETTEHCFKALYDLLQDRFPDTADIAVDLNMAVYKAEMNVMLELIKRDAVEQLLTEKIKDCIDQASTSHDPLALLLHKVLI